MEWPASLTDAMRQSARLVAGECSERVWVDKDGAVRAAKQIAEKLNLAPASAQKRTATHPLHPQNPQNERETLDWLFVIDLLNFSFFARPDEPERYAVRHRGQTWTGYWSLCAAVQRALEAGVPICDPAYYRELTVAQFDAVFHTDADSGRMPLWQERLEALRSAGTVLCERFGGSFLHVVQAAGPRPSADCLLALIAEHFVTFRDESTYGGRRVFFLKRAQILVADIWATYGGAPGSPGDISDIDRLTMFADYRVPQALLALGVLRYSPAVMERLRAVEAGSQPLLVPGDPLEVEIRACSIQAVEALRQALVPHIAPALQPHLHCVALDFWLWDHAKDPRCEAEMSQWPIHLCSGIYY